MTPEVRLRRIGWIAVLVLCGALYVALHLKVQSVHSDVVRAERRIVQLEKANLLLETEYLTRSNQLQLARWNRVEFGYSAPEAAQFIHNERQLAAFGTRGLERDGATIQLAGANMDEDAAGETTPEPSPQPVSLLTGEPIEPALLAAAPAASSPVAASPAARLAVMLPQGPTRVQLTALAGASVP